MTFGHDENQKLRDILFDYFLNTKYIVIKFFFHHQEK